MTLKHCLNKTLATTLALSFVFSPLCGQAQTVNSQDPASLLLAALSASTVDQARSLIQKARSLIPQENLSPSDTADLNALIDQALQNLSTRPGNSVAFDYSKNRITSNPGSNNPPADAADTLRAQLSAAPEIQKGVQELGELRLLRDSSQVEQNVMNLTGQMPSTFDQREADEINEANQPGLLIAYLKSKGLIRSNFSADNKALLDQYKGASLDTIADIIISRSLVGASVAGATREILKVLGQNLGSAGQMTGAFAGITVEAAATFIINTNLTLQIADLYGIRLNSYEEEIAVLSVYAMAKIGGGVALNGTDFQSLLGKVAQRFADARTKVPGNSGFNFLGHLLNNPAVARGLRAAGLMRPSQAVAAAAPAAGTSAPAPTGDHPTPPDQPPSDKPTGRGVRATARSFVLTTLRVGMAAAWANLETRTVGYVAKRFFSLAHERERATQNDLFRLFLMSPSGEGFFKFMIISVNVGQPMTTPADFENPTDPRVKFILNLARSARICSPLDAQQWQLAKAGKLPGASAQTQKILRYDCDNQFSQARYVRLKKEFETFNEIPQDFVTRLRVATREDRLRMGELLLQMQFLDGDRSPNEVKYFDDVVSKYLGLSSADDMDYFSRLHSYIIDHGFMVEAPASPTGFTIGSTASVNPYDLSLGYTPTNGPEPETPLLTAATNPVVPVTPTTPVTPGAPVPSPGPVNPALPAPAHPPLNPGQNPNPAPAPQPGGTRIVPTLGTYFSTPN